jgi:hypothetical protein
VSNPNDIPYRDTWRYYPWNYHIIWSGGDSVYTTQTELMLTKPTDHEGNVIEKRDILLDQSFNFYVVNKSFVDSTGNHPLMDILVHDMDNNGTFNPDADRLLVGDAVLDSRTGLHIWSNTIFVIDMQEAASAGELPQANDTYQIDFNRPFFTNDSLVFTVVGLDDDLDESNIAEEMEKIRVVPNPYVVTNTMEGAVANWDRNQRRQIMFTHIPAQSKIRIFSVSGVLIDEIYVDNSIESNVNAWDKNSEANGTVHWDLRSKEGLEIAAGYYIYHIESKVTGDVKIGKFAVIK